MSNRRNDYYDNLSLQDENIVHKIKNDESRNDKFKFPANKIGAMFLLDSANSLYQIHYSKHRKVYRYSPQWDLLRPWGKTFSFI